MFAGARGRGGMWTSWGVGIGEFRGEDTALIEVSFDDGE